MRLPGLIAVGLGLLVAVGDEPCASAVWWHTGAAVSRFEAASGRLRTLAPSSPVRVVAPLADGGAWVAYGQQLSRLTSDLNAVVNIELPPDSGDAPVHIAAAEDGGVWVAQNRMLRQFDRAGQLAIEWRHTDAIHALEVSGPHSIWVGDVHGIHQYAGEGTVHRFVSLHDDKAPLALLADAAGGYLWVITSRHAVQYDVVAGLMERTRLTLPPAIASAALDATTGTLWLLSGQRLHAFDRDGVQVSSWPIPGGTIADASALAVDIAAQRLWIGDVRGTAAVNLETMQWIRLTNGESTVAIPAMYFRLRPDIMLSEVIAGPPAMIRLQMGAQCNGDPCGATPRYLRQLEFDANLAGVDVTDQFVVDREAGTADLHHADALTVTTDPLRVSAADAYGNRSGVLELDLSALLGGSTRASSLKVNALPTVGITAPANNATFVAPATVAITASAADSDGTITKVEFYRDAVLLGTDTTSPYSYTWANAPVGSYVLSAKAYDNAGGSKSSAVISVQVKANVAPAVALTAPANNSSYVAPATINFAATASDPDGTIAKVDFYQGSTKLATDTASPYLFTWTGVAGGTYSLTAKATDDKGTVTTSAPVTIKVNKPPVVALSAPADNTILQTPASVTITATASDSDGSISKVEFLRNGVLLGTDTTSPYSFAWSSIPIGSFVLTARATDNLGATTTSAARTLTVVANQAPTVAITMPANGATFVAGVPMTIAAAATDPDGTVAKVEFFSNTTTYGNSLVGTDTSSPFSVSTALHEGVNTLTAVVTDNKGAQSTSAPVNITVVANQSPSVALVSPTHGQVFPAISPPDITIVATASDVDGKVVDVKFYYRPSATTDNPAPVPVLIGTATAPPYQVVWNAVPLTGTGICDGTTCAPENYEVTALATDDGGYSWVDTAQITVPNVSPWSVQITAPDDRYPITFIAPATIVLSATASAPQLTGDPVVKVEFFADGGLVGTVVGASNGAPGEYVHVWRNLGAGTRLVTARLHDAAGFIVNSPSVTIRVRDLTQPPKVAVTAPLNGQSILPQFSGLPADTYITAMASDVDGSVTQVEIITDDAVAFSGAGQILTSLWSEIPAGLHVISAAATDSGAARGVSKPIYVQSVPSPRLQAVVITSPAPGAVTVPFVLAAEVAAPDGGLEKVVFYEDSIVLGTVTTPPYRLLIASGNGTRTFSAYAKLHNSSGLTSTPITVSVSGSNTVPTASLTSPTSGQVFNVGAIVPMAANASDANGVITKVEFFANTTLVATSTAVPHSGSWIPAAAGTYAIKAKATDNQLGTGWSSPVSVVVTANTPPQVSITAPLAGQTYFAGVPFTIAATASDLGGAVTKVEFLANSTLIGTVTSPPFTMNWSASAAGPYTLTARATDNSNATTTSSGVSVTIAANAIPTIALAIPRNGQSFVTGGTINLVATASDGDGAVARVEFYAGATLLASVATAPYTYSWSGAASGNYELTARVVDTRGAIIISAPANIAVQPLALTVMSPPAGTSIAADFALIAGTFTAPENSGITVNGAVAATDGQGRFVFNNLPLDLGSNSVEVTLTTLAGQSISQTLTITSTGDAPFQIAVDPDDGMAPLQAKLLYSTRASSVASFRVSNLGSGSLDSSLFGPGILGVLNFASPGVYQPQVTIVYDSGLTYTQTLSVVVRDAAAVDRGFLGMLSDFTMALKHGNKALAMQHLSSPLQVRMEPVIDALSSRMSGIIDSFKGFGAISIDIDVASFAVKRQSGGKTSIFLLDFLRDFDGVWRIDSM